MQPVISVFLFFSLFNLASAQKVTLRIMGSTSYLETAHNKNYILNFKNDPQICNPITQNKPIDLQVQDLETALKTESVSYKLVPVINSAYIFDSNRFFNLQVGIDESYFKIQQIILTSGCKIVGESYGFIEAFGGNEDKYALEAYYDSFRKATNFGKILNYNSIELQSIDDDTSESDEELIEIFGLEKYTGSAQIRLLNFYKQLGGALDEKNSVKEGTYNLLVTYTLSN